MRRVCGIIGWKIIVQSICIIINNKMNNKKEKETGPAAATPAVTRVKIKFHGITYANYKMNTRTRNKSGGVPQNPPGFVWVTGPTGIWAPFMALDIRAHG